MKAESAERFLLALSGAELPLAFEVVGLHDQLRVQLVSRTPGCGPSRQPAPGSTMRDTIDSFDYAIAAIEVVRSFAVYGASGPEFQKQLVEITKVLRAESGLR